MRLIAFAIICMANCLAWAHGFEETTTDASSTPDYQASETNGIENGKRLATKTIQINSVEGHCSDNVCRDFNFDKLDEIAVFDLKTNIHILDDTTYDVRKPLEANEIIFRNSTFAHFPLQLFYALDVRELDMRECSIRKMVWENFLMANRLRILLLSDNQLTTIRKMTFNQATELQFLFLSNNQLHRLVDESFKGLEKLVTLDLSNNRLRSLPEELFSYTPQLRDLFLTGNQLYEIAEQQFTPLTNLITLSLRNNRLGALHETVFSKQRLLDLDVSDNTRLGRLILNVNADYLFAKNCSLYQVNIYGSVKNVDLRDNIIHELYFSQPETVEDLNLRNNALEQISSLKRAAKLTHLDLSDNPGLGPYIDALEGNSLHVLDLSNTSLDVLPVAFIAEQANLKTLNVSNNQLTEVNPSNFIYLEKLHSFYIHANNWNCYNLRALIDFVIKPHNIKYTHDDYNDDFPGEYLEGIACMYRVTEEVSKEDDYNNNRIIIPQNMKKTRSNDDNYNDNDNYINDRNSDDETYKANTDSLELKIDSVHKELKAVVGFYEQKFKIMSDRIDALSNKVASYENMTENFFKNVAITV